MKRQLKMLAFGASFLLTLFGSLSLSGCAALTGADAAAAAAIQTGIELATSVYINHKGGGTPAGNLAVAVQVKAIATELEGAATGNLTVAQFNTQMQTYISKLDPTKQIIATALLAQIDVYFAQQVANSGSILKAQASAAATVVLNDIIAACALYGA